MLPTRHHASTSQDSFRLRAFAVLGRLWARVEAWFARMLAGLHRRRHRLHAEARILGAEVIQLGAQLWDKVDDLPFTPTAFKLTPVRTQYYGHGAFMGAAPALFADRNWRRILAFLMPDVFEQVRQAMESGAGPQQVMPMLENNPVLAAFGVFRGAQSARDNESPHHLSGVEWDLFLDSELLAEWEAARAEPHALERIMARIIDTSLIAHATPADTVQESMGICQYRDVRKTPKTGLGGVEMDSWLDLFARSLELASSEDLAAAITRMSGDPRSDSEEECMLYTFAPPWPVRRCVDVYKRVTAKPSISIILDVKSLRSSPEFLGDLVRALNTHGVHVVAVASFLREEVAGVSSVSQVVDGTSFDGPREIQFFHFAGDLQHACDDGVVELGQSVMFNGASLLDVVTTDGGRPVYSTKLRVVAELEEYRKRFGLHIGFYVQEGDCDHAAASLLSDLCEARPNTFELGFAWGGLRDEAHLASSDVGRLGYGSQRMLEYVGKARQWRLGGDG